METKPTKTIEDWEKTLNSLVKTQEEDSLDLARVAIERNKLPFIIVDKLVESEALGSKRVWFLQSVFSGGELWLQKFITEDPETKEMKASAKKMIESPHEVLIYGPTGTGKELIAKSQIGKKEGSIKAFNCAGSTRELIEAELFGHTANAFTGANRKTEGLITLANGGVMFMDEIGEMPMDIQAKILRVMQEKTLRKVGGREEEPVVCKFVFASNKDLKKMVELGTFREDLYARIRTLELKIKPLIDRKVDVIPILESLPGGKAFLVAINNKVDMLDLSYNVRSLQAYVIRHMYLGKVEI